MAKPYTLYAWKLSYFSAKARALLKFKEIPYKEKDINAWDFFYSLPKKTGIKVMPIIKNDVGVWLQDTTELGIYLERRYPKNPIYPSSPKQKFVAELLEAWADEWWIPIAMHYRWSFSQNHDAFYREAGDSLLPWFPRNIKNILVNKIANTLKNYLPVVGVVPEQIPILESWSKQALDELDNHFKEHKYLLGSRPCIADFALLGPLGPHLARDPYPKQELIPSRPYLKAWINRVTEGANPQGQYLDNDQIPTTLLPIIARLMNEFMPMVQAIADQTNHYVKSKGVKIGKVLPRTVGTVRFPMAEMPYQRRALPYSLWMVQQCFARVFQQPLEERQKIHSWLIELGYPSLLHSHLGPPLKRHKLQTKLAGPHPERRKSKQ
ncbi:glutathione S-transferase family protein [Paraferrimonas sp. SM1919]|uniref:glutathione S-transferase family protein n=1 Tax=Paraferrimonas sp. SM1919 TaxID=2662263 RepID=UPI0013D67684|nr:glutathione S-transferase family protein [Paraferrimonas sp. SM1919]